MAPLKYSFDNRKATQAAAFILRQAGDKGISKGKLVKMLYAADRRQMKRIGKPITGDRLVAMEHGPVLSKILDYVDGDVVNAYWATYIEKANPHNHHVHLKADAPTDLLTEKEKEALTTAYEFFKDMSWDDVRNYCHKNFKEWTDPNGSSKAIDHEDLLRAAQKPASFIDEIRSQQQERILLKKIFA